MKTNKIYLLTILWLIAIQIQAQDWQRKLDAPYLAHLWTNSDFNGQDVQQTSDGNYVMTGVQSFPTGAPRDYPCLVKVDQQGQTLWEKSYFSDNADPAWFNHLALLEMPNQNLLLAGISSYYDVYVLQLNPVGDTVWTQKIPSSCDNLTGPCNANNLKLKATPDGNYILAISLNLNHGVEVIKLAPNGTILWRKLHANVYIHDIAPTYDGGYIMAGQESVNPLLYKLDVNGDSSWLQIDTNGGPYGYEAVVQTPDSAFLVSHGLAGTWGEDPVISKINSTGTSKLWTSPVLANALGGRTGKTVHLSLDANGFCSTTGYTEIAHPTVPGAYNSVGFVSKLDLTGTILVERIYEQIATSNGEAIRPTADNGYIMVGTISDLGGSGTQGYLVKMDAAMSQVGQVFQGCVYYDMDIDCALDSGEATLGGWNIEIINRNTGQINYTTTNSAGYYSTSLDTGDYTVKAIPLNGLWGFCVDSFNVNSVALYNADTLHFAAQALVSCPLLQVDISTPILRACSSSSYTISYCNNGTTDAVNAYVEVRFDTTFSVLGSNVPYIGPFGATYTFNLGTVPAQSCGSFTIEAMLSCYVQVGETHCAQAHIYPDSNCLTGSPLWDQSDIDVEGICYGDSIVFIIRNVGSGNMLSQRQYFVTEDHVIFMVQPFQLNAGDSTTEVVQTAGGVYRLQAEQDPYHPYSTYSAAGVQMCVGSGFTTNGALGVLVQYAEDDGSPAESIDCRQNVASWDPNDKQASPFGYGVSHYINQNIDLEYHIRFQNTGTDTAFKVTIYDTLSPFLNPVTVVPGASSHAYTWSLDNTGTLVVDFENIMLPDSGVNEPASHGFVKFRVKQDFLNPLGTVINNRAGIVFDSNEPVLTNTTFHTVDENFIVAVDIIDKQPNVNVLVYPNPFEYQTTLEVKGAVFDELEVRVFDALGRTIQYQKTSFEEQIILQRNGMTTGIYYFQLLGDGQVIGTGKITVQ